MRFIDAFVDTLDLATLGFKQANLNATGRPPYHPSILIKLYIYGYLNRIRSSRCLEAECHRNVELMWLLLKLKPDHKTIADFRRNHVKPLKGVCREFTLLCKKLKLFGGEFISIDGSKFEAVNSVNLNYSKKRLQKLIAEINDRISIYFQDLEKEDETEKDLEKPSIAELNEKVASLKVEKEAYQKLLEDLEESGEKQISLTDSDSRMMRTGNHGNDVCYNGQIAVDDKHHLIIANDVTNSSSDRTSFSMMAKAAQEILGVETLEATADKGYHSMKEVAASIEAGIVPLIPRPEQSYNKPRGLFSKADFIYDEESDTYTCPAGATLSFRSIIEQSGQRYRNYGTPACYKCKLKKRCTSNPKKRRIFRLEGEHLLNEMAQRLKERPDIMAKRRCLVEHPFGTLKRWMGHNYFLLRGLDNVKMEFALSTMAYNMKRAINILGVRNLIDELKKV